MAAMLAKKELEEMPAHLLKEVIFIVGKSDWESMSPSQQLEKANMWKMDAMANMVARELGDDIVTADKPSVTSVLTMSAEDFEAKYDEPVQEPVPEPVQQPVQAPVRKQEPELIIDDASATKELEEMPAHLLKEVIFIVGDSEWESMSPSRRLHNAKIWKMDASANMIARAMGETIVRPEKPSVDSLLSMSEEDFNAKYEDKDAEPKQKQEQKQEEENLVDNATAEKELAAMSQFVLKEVIFIVGESEWNGMSPGKRLQQAKLWNVDALAIMAQRSIGEKIVKPEKPTATGIPTEAEAAAERKKEEEKTCPITGKAGECEGVKPSKKKKGKGPGSAEEPLSFEPPSREGEMPAGGKGKGKGKGKDGKGCTIS